MATTRKISSMEAEQLPIHPDPNVSDADIAWLGGHLRSCACRKCLTVVPDEALGVFSPQAYSVYMAFLADHGRHCRQVVDSRMAAD